MLAAAGLRVVAPDQRGYGNSDKPAYGLDALADDVIGIATHSATSALAGWATTGLRRRLRLAAERAPNIERLATLNAPYPATLRTVEVRRSHLRART